MREDGAVLALGALALATGCVAADQPVVTPPVCSLKGEGFAGASEQEVCAIFAAALGEGADGLAVELTVVNEHEARLVLRDAGGTEVLSLGHSVSDAALSPAQWSAFARAAALQLDRSRAR